MRVIEKYEVVMEPQGEISECPSWDRRTGTLSWVDLADGNIHMLVPSTGIDVAFPVGCPVGAAIARSDGGFVVCHRGGISLMDIDRRCTVVAAIEADNPEIWMNDGKCDPAGRLFAGTMHERSLEGSCALYRLDAHGGLSRAVDGVTISNGIGWSPDAATMYYVDSPTRRIDAFTFDVDSGAISNRRIFVSEPGVPEPDGLCVDEEGGVWVAFWAGARVVRYTDEGRVDALVRLPISCPTSCCFGGESLDELYITSAQPGDGSREPLAGGIFRVRPDVRGLPTTPFGG